MIFEVHAANPFLDDWNLDLTEPKTVSGLLVKTKACTLHSVTRILDECSVLI